MENRNVETTGMDSPHTYVCEPSGRTGLFHKLCLLTNLMIKQRVLEAAIIIVSVFMFQYVLVGLLYYVWDFRDDNYRFTPRALFRNLETLDAAAFLICAFIGIPLNLIYVLTVKNLFKIPVMIVIGLVDIACYVGTVLLTIDLPAEASAYWTMFFVWLIVFDCLVLEPVCAAIKFGLLKWKPFKY